MDVGSLVPMSVGLKVEIEPKYVGKSVGLNWILISSFNSNIMSLRKEWVVRRVFVYGRYYPL